MFAGTRQGTPDRTGRLTGAPARVDARAVREWAQEQGIAVSARGRVPSDVVEKYQAAVG